MTARPLGRRPACLARRPRRSSPGPRSAPGLPGHPGRSGFGKFSDLLMGWAGGPRPRLRRPGPIGRRSPRAGLGRRGAVPIDSRGTAPPLRTSGRTFSTQIQQCIVMTEDAALLPGPRADAAKPGKMRPTGRSRETPEGADRPASRCPGPGRSIPRTAGRLGGTGSAHRSLHNSHRLEATGIRARIPIGSFDGNAYFAGLIDPRRANFGGIAGGSRRTAVQIMHFHAI